MVDYGGAVRRLYKCYLANMCHVSLWMLIYSFFSEIDGYCKFVSLIVEMGFCSHAGGAN